MCDVGGHLVALWMSLVGHAFVFPNAFAPLKHTGASH